VDAGVIKTGDMTETANDLVSALEDLLRPKRINSRPVSVQANLWALTGHLSGITELKKLSMKRIKAKEGQGGGAEKHTFFTTETPEHLVNTVVYRGPPGDDSVYIGLESSLGCGVRCRFCKNHRYRVDGKGKICPFIRNLTHGELDSQAYLASTFSPMVERVLRRGCKARLVFNFTAEGEPLFNLENVVLACRDFAKIRNAEIIITSTFPLGPLRKLNDLYSDLEKLTLYWSAIALNQKVREWLMPGTTGESIPEIRDLVTEFSHKLGTRPTASFSLFEVNSSDKDIDLILKFFDGQQDWWRIKFMLGLPGSLEGYSDVHEERMLEINDRVSKAGFDSRTRTIYGIEEFSGCGNTLDERTRRGLNPYAPPMSKAG
jgi:adenine C2-methylase RlmN of 23S rRNA A2503 and tRNA A37